MKMINFKLYRFVALSFCILLSACETETLTQFDSPAAVNFDIISIVGSGVRVYSSDYTFLVNPEDEHIHEVAVSIMGVATDYERTFDVEVVDDSVTTASPSHYEIIGGIVPAGAYQGKLYIRLFKTDDLKDQTVSLKVRLVDSDDFKVGNKASSEFVINWTNRAVPPAINAYSRNFFIQNWSTGAYRIFTETTGLTNFLLADYRAIGDAGAIALGTKFGDYIKQWNLDHYPDSVLTHDDGVNEGQEMVPKHYTRSKYD